MNWNSFYNLGHRCYPCSMKKSGRDKALSFDEVKERVEKSGEFILLNENYERSTIPLRLKHLKCGHEFNILLSNINRGDGCPICSETSGERRIRRFFECRNIIPDRQVWYPDCRFINPLKFDFYIKEFDTLIEFQGGQHFFPVDFNGIGKENAKMVFEEIKIRDEIKRKYCEKNNLNILYINYWEFDEIDKILSEYFNI